MNAEKVAANIKDIAILEQDLKRAEGRLGLISDAYLIRVDSLAEYKEKKEQNTRERQAIETEIAHLHQINKSLAADDPEVFIKRIDWLEDCWHNVEISVADKNNLLRAIVEKIRFQGFEEGVPVFEVQYR